MAIISLQQPSDTDTTHASYNPLIYIAESNTIGIIKVIGDVFINGIYVNTIESEVDFGTTDRFTFNISSVSRSFLVPDFITGIGNQNVNLIDSAETVEFKVYEATLIGGLIVTNWVKDGLGVPDFSFTLINAINGAFQYAEDYQDFTQENPFKKFLTTRPDFTRIKRSEILQIDYLTMQGVEMFAIQRDSSGSTIAPTGGITPLIAPTIGKGGMSIDFSLFDPLAVTVEMNLSTGFFNTDSEIRNFFIEDSCNTEFKIRWQNPLGGHDQFIFDGNGVEKIKRKSDAYIKKLSTNYVIGDRGEEVLDVKSNQEFSLYTTTQRPEVIRWLGEIGKSQSVFLETTDGLIPVRVIGQSSNILNEFNPIIQFNIRIKLNKDINQNG